MLLGQENTIMGSAIYTDDDFREVISGMDAGLYPMGGWIEHIKLDELEKAYHDLRLGRKVKIMVDL
jgi:threonine dehydrogenase-like Zn-dependent dehydrogenase